MPIFVKYHTDLIYRFGIILALSGFIFKGFAKNQGHRYRRCWTHGRRYDPSADDTCTTYKMSLGNGALPHILLFL